MTKPKQTDRRTLKKQTRKTTTRKKVSKKNTDIGTNTSINTRARARRKKTLTTAEMVQSLTPPVLVNHDPAAYLTDPAHEIVKAIHAVAVQVKELRGVLTHHHPEPATLERLDDDSDSDIERNLSLAALKTYADDTTEQLEAAHDRISELSDANTRLIAKNTFLLTIIDSYKKKPQP